MWRHFPRFVKEDIPRIGQQQTAFAAKRVCRRGTARRDARVRGRVRAAVSPASANNGINGLPLRSNTNTDMSAPLKTCPYWPGDVSVAGNLPSTMLHSRCQPRG
jgi:hypothetical protein